MSNAILPAQVKGLTYTVLKSPEFSSIAQKAPNGAELRIPQYQNPLWHFTTVWDYLYDTFYSPNNTQAYAPFTDLQTLMGFFLQRLGGYDDFLFFDSTDYSAAGIRSGVWASLKTYPLSTVIIDRSGHAQLATATGISGTQYPTNFSTAGGTTIDGSVTWTDQGFWPLGFPNVPITLPVVQDASGNYYSPLQRNCGGFPEDITDLIPGTLQVWQGGVPTLGYTIAGPGLAVPGASYMGLYLKWTGIPVQPVTAIFNFYFRVKFDGDTQDFERWAQGLWTIGGSKSKNGSGYLKLVTARPKTNV